MKTLRNFVLSSAAALALIAPAYALAQQAPPQQQVAPPPGQGWQGSHRGHGFMGMFRRLNLSSAQQTQIQQIMQQYRAAHPRGSAPDPTARKQMRDRIMNVLTPQQRTQLQQQMQQMREQRMRDGDREPGPPAPQSTPQP